MIPADAPHQNGRAERHGGWVKDRLDAELRAGECIVHSLEELDWLLCWVVHYKNRFFHRGGHSPMQMVFGQNPRLPLEILSDESCGAPGWQVLEEDLRLLDATSAEMARQHRVRMRARELALTSDARARLQVAQRTPTHRDRCFAPGQRVLVRRRQDPSTSA